MVATLKPDSDGAERLASSPIRRQRNGLPAFHQAQSRKRLVCTWVMEWIRLPNALLSKLSLNRFFMSYSCRVQTFGFIYQDESGEAKRQQKFFVVVITRLLCSCKSRRNLSPSAVCSPSRSRSDWPYKISSLLCDGSIKEIPCKSPSTSSVPAARPAAFSMPRSKPAIAPLPSSTIIRRLLIC